MSVETAPSGNQRDDGILRTELPADLTSARRARQAIRDALVNWAIDDPDRDAELLASELVANAAEHSTGSSIGFAVRRDSRDGIRPGVTCEVTDSSPALPATRHADPDQERGRGMGIVHALADACGVRAGPDSKTTWFTLALHERINRISRQAEGDPEAGS